jgi:hypothetical protein
VMNEENERADAADRQHDAKSHDQRDIHCWTTAVST